MKLNLAAGSLVLAASVVFYAYNQNSKFEAGQKPEPVLSIEYPAFASAAVSADFEKCGAIVIHPDILLAAAHCQGLFLAAGAIIDGDEFKSQHGVIAEYMHSQFTTNSTVFDLMLVRLEAPTTVDPIQLFMDPLVPAIGSKLSVLGLQERTLMKVDVYVNLCGGLVEDEYSRQLFCTGAAACSITGGPVFQDEMLAGFATGCSEDHAIYTRISAFSDFIHMGICSYSQNPPSMCDSLLQSVPETTKTTERSGEIERRAATTDSPYAAASESPSISAQPSANPSAKPSATPSAKPSAIPSASPSELPSAQPSQAPTSSPSELPSAKPSSDPSDSPSEMPSHAPSAQPSSNPSAKQIGRAHV